MALFKIDLETENWYFVSYKSKEHYIVIHTVGQMFHLILLWF